MRQYTELSVRVRAGEARGVRIDDDPIESIPEERMAFNDDVAAVPADAVNGAFDQPTAVVPRVGSYQVIGLIVLPPLQADLAGNRALSQMEWVLVAGCACRDQRDDCQDCGASHQK